MNLLYTKIHVIFQMYNSHFQGTCMRFKTRNEN